MIDLPELNDKLLLSNYMIEDKLEDLTYDDINRVTHICSRSIAQIIYHLAIYENMYFSKMIYRFLFNKDTRVKTYDDTEIMNAKLSKKQLRMWIRHIANERWHNVKLLNDYIYVLQNNHVKHEIHDDLYIEDIIKKVISHDIHHMNQINKLLVYFKEHDNGIHH